MAGVATFLSMMEVTRPVIEGMEEIITQNDLERIADGQLFHDLNNIVITIYKHVTAPKC